MAKQHLLIVDSDPKSLRVLEVSLKKAGFSVTRANNGADAIDKIKISAPDMVISETAMPEMDGFELNRVLKENPDWSDIPVVFLTARKSIEDKIHGLEQGIEDYLTKPIFIREILARVTLVMQRRQRERLENRGSKTKFSGNLSDMGIIDLIQTIDISRKSGVIHVDRNRDAGDIYFRDGKVIDAETRSRKGEEAVYRMLVWSDGTFEINFVGIDRPDKITLSTQGLLMEGMRRLDEWGRLQEQLPPLTSVFDVNDEYLSERLGEIPDEINALLRHFDAKRSLMEVVDLCPLGDLEALTIISKLYFEGLIGDISDLSPDDAMLHPEESFTPETPHPDEEQLMTGMMGDSLPAASPLPSILPSADEIDNFEMRIDPPRPIPEVRDPEKSSTLRLPRLDILPRPESAPRQSLTGGFISALSSYPKPIATAASDTPAHPVMTPVAIPVAAPVAVPVAAPVAVPVAAPIPTPVDTRVTIPVATPVAAPAPAAYAPAPIQPMPATIPAAQMTAASTPTLALATEQSEKTGAEVENAPEYRSVPKHEPPLPAFRKSADEWDFDESAPPEKRRIFPAVLAVLILGAVAALVWYRFSEPAVMDFDAAPVKNKGIAAVPPSTSEKVSTTPAVKDTDKPIIPANTAVTETDKAADAPSDSAATTDPPVDSAADRDPAPVKTGTAAAIAPETLAEYEALVENAMKMPRKKKLEALIDAVDMNPNGEEALAELALMMAENKKLQEQGLEYGARAVAINPDNAKAWLAVGYIYQLMGKDPESKNAYQKCAAASGPAMFVRDCKRMVR